MAKVTPPFEDLPAVPLVKLHLNASNPRHEPLADEEAIIAQLYQHELMAGLLQDIAERGTLSPIERIGVIDLAGMPGHFVVVEGNRRVCALKLLADPRRAPSPEARQVITKLLERTQALSAVPVVRFRDMKAADPFIDLRHLGTQDGRGTKPWNANQKSRRAGQDSANALALAVLDRGIEARWLTATEREGIAITTLTRYLSNPVVRHTLGLQDNKRLVFTHEAAEVDAALREFVKDALRPADGSDPHALSSRSSKGDRQTYAQGLRNRGLAPRTLLAAPIEPPPPARQAGTTAASRRHRSSAARRRVLEGQAITAKDKIVRHLVDELRIDTEGHEFTVNYLLRALYERAMVLFAQRHRVHRPGMNDRQLMQACIDQLEALKTPETKLRNLRQAHSSQDLSWSFHNIGHAVHGGAVPTVRDLNACWTNWEPAVRLMLELAEAP